MKRKLITATLFIASIVGAFFIGKSQTKTEYVPEYIPKIIEKPIEKEVIPEGYIDTNSHEFVEHYIDLREIIDFKPMDKCWGVYLYTEDNAYYWGE